MDDFYTNISKILTTARTYGVGNINIDNNIYLWDQFLFTRNWYSNYSTWYEQIGVYVLDRKFLYYSGKPYRMDKNYKVLILFFELKRDGRASLLHTCKWNKPEFVWKPMILESINKLKGDLNENYR